MSALLPATLLLVFAAASDPDASSQQPRLGASVQLEGSLVWQSRNWVQIPADTGTRFSLTDFGHGPEAAGRLYVGVSYGRHELRGLVAPLQLELEGQFSQPVAFQGTSFAAGVPTRARYRFDSYRLTYRYTILDSEKWSLKLGVTGKIRDAEIALSQGALSAARTNTGFVPLLHLQAVWRLAPSWSGILDVDALAAPQGRAEDVALLVGYRMAEPLQILAGYRTVEGGSEGGGDVYNFTWLHYAVVGLLLAF